MPSVKVWSLKQAPDQQRRCSSQTIIIIFFQNRIHSNLWKWIFRKCLQNDN